MKISNDRRYIVAVMVLVAAISPLMVHAQSVEILEVDVKAVAKGYRVSKLIGSDVINEKNEEIGEIDDFIIGQDKVLFVILQVGGFLGLGGHLVAMPANAIDMETVKGKIRIKSASRSQLQKMPEFNYGKDQGQKK
jgi:sporulation protein YlmC with PRC-barrel domain